MCARVQENLTVGGGSWRSLGPPHGLCLWRVSFQRAPSPAHKGNGALLLGDPGSFSGLFSYLKGKSWCQDLVGGEAGS